MMKIMEAAEEQQQQEKGQDDQEKEQKELSNSKAQVNPPDVEEEGSLEMRQNFQKQFEEIMTSTL